MARSQVYQELCRVVDDGLAEQPSGGLRTDSGAAAVDGEADPRREATRICRRQQSGGALDPPLIGKRQLERKLRPVVDQVSLDPAQLFD